MSNNRILIADDEPDLTEIIGAVAEDLGFQVTVVHEGNEVISRVGTVDPGVIALDLRMPGTDGLEVLKQLAEIGCRANILLMSGLGQSTLNSVEHVGRDKNLNVIGSLTKPLTPDEIESALAPLLNGAQKEIDDVQIAAPASSSGFGLQTQYLLHTHLDEDATESQRATLAATWILDNKEELTGHELQSWAHSNGISKGLFDRILRDALLAANERDSAKSNMLLGISLGKEALADENTVEHLCAVLENGCFPIGRFVLEISDEAIRSDFASAAEQLSRLRIKGFRIAVTTSSSSDELLAMIDKLPMDEIIVDFAWLQNCSKVANDMELEFNYSSLSSVAKKKGIVTCADNVNDKVLLDFVKRCDFCQARGEVLQGYQPISSLGQAMA